MEKQIYEYELIDIEFEDIEFGTMRVCEEPVAGAFIQYDDDGIPMGQSMEEIRMREALIKEHFNRWFELHPEGYVYNDAIEQLIHVKGISVIEAKQHSAKSYKSTLAIMMMDEVLKNALPVRRVPTKPENKNQAVFAYMLVMVYRDEELGTIKLTIGVKSDQQNIQYGISALRPGEPLIDDSKRKVQKKKKRISR